MAVVYHHSHVSTWRQYANQLFDGLFDDVELDVGECELVMVAVTVCVGLVSVGRSLRLVVLLLHNRGVSVWYVKRQNSNRHSAYTIHPSCIFTHHFPPIPKGRAGN